MDQQIALSMNTRFPTKTSAEKYDEEVGKFLERRIV